MTWSSMEKKEHGLEEQVQEKQRQEEHEEQDTVVSGPIWTNLVPNRNVVFFIKIVSYGQIRASRYK